MQKLLSHFFHFRWPIESSELKNTEPLASLRRSAANQLPIRQLQMMDQQRAEQVNEQNLPANLKEICSAQQQQQQRKG